MSPPRERVGTFTAYSDEGGEFVIYAFQEIIAAGSQDTPTATLRGKRVLQTAGGLKVNRKEKGVYEIPKLGNLIVRSDDENAP